MSWKINLLKVEDCKTDVVLEELAILNHELAYELDFELST